MSGFEVAGIVLGVVPLVISALEHYKEGKGLVATVIKFRGLLDDLIHYLKSQRIFFYLDVRQLLQEARVAEMVDEIDATEERCISILCNARSGYELRQYLGHLHSPFLEILERYEKCLKTIVGKLGHILRPVNAAKDDLSAIIQANANPSTSLAIKGRLEFTINRKSLFAILDDLRTERFSLKTIIEGVKTQRDYEAREPSRASRKLTQDFGDVRATAMSLFNAMCKSCTCDCHSSHKVMMRLDNRLSNQKEESHPPGKARQDVIFQLFFPINDGTHLETIVTARTGEDASEKSPNQFQSLDKGSGKVTLNLPAITVTTVPCHSHTTCVGITDICKHARQIHGQGLIFSLELAADILELMEGPPKSQHSFTTSITLEDFLSETSQNEDARMTPKQQTLLALDIASSILQLQQTFWCRFPWNKTAIKFILQKMDNSNVAICMPFVEQTISIELLKDQQNRPNLGTKATLLELAILLLEIWHYKPIEAWIKKKGMETAQTLEARTIAAIRWLECTSERLPPHHLTAIEQCLAFCSGRLRFWDESEFQRLYCENIIKPLQESCKAW